MSGVSKTPFFFPFNVAVWAFAWRCDYVDGSVADFDTVYNS